MCGTPPKMHAPDSDGNALCGQKQVRSAVRVATSVDFFKQFTPLGGSSIAAYTTRGGKCKACEKKVS